MSLDPEKGSRVRIVVADDNTKLRNAVIQLLEPTFAIVGEASDGRALIDAVGRTEPEIAVVDISMPVMNGIDAVSEIKAGGSPVKIIFLTVNEDPDFFRAAFGAGGSAYVLKKRMTKDLVPAIEAVLADHEFTSPGYHLSQ
jgi:DNA-binding NarL/FixJ family response regulator